MIPTDPDTGPVERKDLVKGYEIEKNKYVIVTNEELQEVKLETTRTIDIERFVDADEIDRLYWNDPYFLLPDGKTGTEAYVVIRDALEHTGRIAIGRVVMHTRERVVALEPRDKGIVAYTLRSDAEVIDPKMAFEDIPHTRSDKRMVEIAEKIIEQQEGAFDPSMFEDRYEKALRELIKRKQKGEKPVKAEPVEDTNVIDLMEALKKSLKHKGAAAARTNAPTPTRTSKRPKAREANMSARLGAELSPPARAPWRFSPGPPRHPAFFLRQRRPLVAMVNLRGSRPGSSPGFTCAQVIGTAIGRAFAPPRGLHGATPVEVRSLRR